MRYDKLVRWPGYTASRGKPYRWKNRSPFDEYVALKAICAGCSTPVALLGRTTHPNGDLSCVFWAALHGSVLSFQRDAHNPDDEVSKVLVRCATTRRGKRCAGEPQISVSTILEVLDALWAPDRKRCVVSRRF